MYITKKEVALIDQFYKDVVQSGYPNNKGLACEVHNLLIALYFRRKETNTKQYNYIKTKRENNPNYGRLQKEWRKETRPCKKNGEN